MSSMLLLTWAVPMVATIGDGAPLSERLFQRSLPNAERIWNGRFIQEMANGTLPSDVYQRYLYQDNLYLGRYARAFAALGAKMDMVDDFLYLVNQGSAFLNEHKPGSNDTANVAIFERDASNVTVAYATLEDQAVWSEDTLVGVAGVLPCQRVYDWLYTRMKNEIPVVPGNPYQLVIDQYSDPKNHAMTKRFEAILNDQASRHGLWPKLEDRVQWYYDEAMRHEADFFDQGFGAHTGRLEQDAAPDLSPLAGRLGLRLGMSAVIADSVAQPIVV